METCVAHASAAIVQRVPPELFDDFKKWQRGVTAAAQTFPGYEGTDSYPPAGDRTDWVTVIHFDDDPSLQLWLDSPERGEWVQKLRATIGDFELQKFSGGFSQWFAGLTKSAESMPPNWKMALTVLFGLYPTVMLLTIFVSPYTSPLGFSYSMLIGNALSVALLQWLVVPALMVVLGPWLKANSPATRMRSYAGIGALLMILAAIATLLRPVTG